MRCKCMACRRWRMPKIESTHYLLTQLEELICVWDEERDELEKELCDLVLNRYEDAVIQVMRQIVIKYDRLMKEEVRNERL